jgi:hypothetical protein
MPDSPTDRNLTGAHPTRREFIKNVLVKTAYAAPIVATFSVSNANAAKKTNRKISKVSRPSSGDGIKYDKKSG